MDNELDFEVYWSGRDMQFETLEEAITYAKDMTLEEYGNNRDVAYIKKRYRNHYRTTSVRWIEGAIWVIEDIT